MRWQEEIRRSAAVGGDAICSALSAYVCVCPHVRCVVSAKRFHYALALLMIAPLMIVLLMIVLLMIVLLMIVLHY